jgi:hypothetical protein
MDPRVGAIPTTARFKDILMKTLNKCWFCGVEECAREGDFDNGRVLIHDRVISIRMTREKTRHVAGGVCGPCLGTQERERKHNVSVTQGGRYDGRGRPKAG